MVRAKIAIARIKWAGYRLSIWALGIVSGVAFLYAYNLYSIETTLVLENKTIEIVRVDRVVPIEWQEGIATAYSKGDGMTPGSVMANGEAVHVGAAACPSFLKLGDRIEIEGIGVFTCSDRMAKRFRDGSYFDLYHETVEAALAFGRQDIRWRAL